MSKKKWIVAGVSTFFLLGSLVVAVAVVTRPQKQTVPTFAESQLGQEDATLRVIGDLVYEDASGFSFKYPGNLTVSDVTPEDEPYYSVLSLKKDGQELTISVKDTKFTSVDDWLKNNVEAPKNSALIGASTLAEISAKQYVYADKLLTAAVDQGVLYAIESQKDGAYWDGVHDLVVGSFSFKKISSSGSGAQGGDVVYEDEEVVE